MYFRTFHLSRGGAYFAQLIKTNLIDVFGIKHFGDHRACQSAQLCNVLVLLLLIRIFLSFYVLCTS